MCLDGANSIKTAAFRADWHPFGVFCHSGHLFPVYAPLLHFVATKIDIKGGGGINIQGWT
jgi:hypothetical protein